MHEEMRVSGEQDTELLFVPEEYDFFFEELLVNINYIKENYDSFVKKNNKSALRRARSSARQVAKMIRSFLKETKPSSKNA